MKKNKNFEKQYRCTLNADKHGGFIPCFESRYYAQKFIDDRISDKRTCIIGKSDNGYLIYDIHLIAFSKDFFNDDF